MLNRKFISSTCLFLSVIFLKAQFYNMPGDFSFSLLTQRRLAIADPAMHSSLQPYIPFFSPKYQFVPDSHQVFRFIKDDPALDLIFRKHFLRIEPRAENFRLRIDPLVNFESGRDISAAVQGKLYTNTRGFIASGEVGKRFYFESMLSENQSLFPDYIADAANATQVVPGQARWKRFKNAGFDYAFASGFISIQASGNFNIQFGHGKHKAGNGYRSLLWSDNAFNYPYARFTQQWFRGKVQYTNVYASLMNLLPASVKFTPYTERLFQKKSAAFQYLSFNLTPKFNFSLFQSVIWQAGDQRNRQHLDHRYFNPVIFSQMVQMGADHRNNVVAGADAQIKLTDKVSIYGQLMFDNFTKEGRGSQYGVKLFDLFGIRNLCLQAEYNHAGENAFEDPDSSAFAQSYTHYNQALAYTPGQGGELLFIADYKVKRFFIHSRYHYQEHLKGGKASDFVQAVHARVGYVINPTYNLNVALGLTSRSQNFSTFGRLDTRSNYIYLAFRTSIYNLYYDF